ncbi:hypothetical protein ACFY2H_39150 [Streptomyces griseofuscus]|uniref:hypothetical protein n=1 Tax=Streptomyces griseofuscus TaxID=146922 RepID=UPI0036978BA5
MVYTDDVRAALWETWQREAYGQSWAELRERLRYSSDASWEPYFEAFDEERRDLSDLPMDGSSWEEYCFLVLDTFIEWLATRVDWQQFEAQWAGAHEEPGAQGWNEPEWGHGVEQDMSDSQWGYGAAQDTSTDVPARYPEAHAQAFQESTPHADAGAVDMETAREALQIFASPSDDPSVLTDEHMAALAALPIEVEADVDGPPPLDGR